MTYEETPITEDNGTDTVLCSLDTLEDPGSREFRVGRRERMFVIRKDNEVFGYMNLCPHQGTVLDWKPNTFLTTELDYVMCATHGALFEIEDGKCVYGPCLGRSLAPIRIRVEGGNVLLDE
jgi:nitrite reductase/ring-hydroxylating ferredoxin subunit